MTNNKSGRVLIFTGGHHTGSLSVAVCLKQSGWRIIWLGHRHSQWQDRSDSAEYREVTAAGIEFIDLKAGKLYHTYNPLKLLRLPWGFVQAFLILLGLKIRLKSGLRGIVSSGGYLGVPVVVCGRLLSIPAISHEQTVTAGWANRLISVFARKIAVSWPTSLSHFPRSKAVLTGLPIRPEIRNSASRRLRRRPDLVYITGGKQGSHVINQAVFSALPRLVSHYHIIHQTGSSTLHHDYLHAGRLKASLPRIYRSRYQISEYLPADRVAVNLGTAMVVVSRAGAHIIQELMLFRTRSVLIPIPWSSHSEQQKNAQMLAEKNLAVILPQDQLTGQSLQDAIDRAKALKVRQITVPRDGLQQLVKLIESEFGQSNR